MSASRVGISLGESTKRWERKFKSLDLHEAVTWSPRLFVSEVLGVKLVTVPALCVLTESFIS